MHLQKTKGGSSGKNLKRKRVEKISCLFVAVNEISREMLFSGLERLFNINKKD